MKFPIAFVFVLYALAASAQNAEFTGGDVEIAVFTPSYDGKDNSIKDTPYSTKEFIPVKLDYMDKTQFIRFNLVDDIVELRSKTGTSLMLDLRRDFKIELLDGSDRYYQTGSYGEKAMEKRSFFEVILQTESYSLFKKEQKKFVKKEKAEAFKETKPAQFIFGNNLFYISDFKSGTKKLLKLPRKKKKFIDFFDKNGNALEKFLKQEKLDIKRKDDLIKILNFIFLKS